MGQSPPGAAALAPHMLSTYHQMNAGREPVFTTTLPYPDHPRFARLARLLPLAQASRHSLWDELRLIGQILRATRQTRVLLLFSSWGCLHPDLLATVLLSFLPPRRRPTVLLFGEMWQPGRGLRHRLERWLVQRADRVVFRYFVNSSEELDLFPRLWAVDAGKMRFCPYFATIDERDLARPAPADGRYIFAGGNSFRDYDNLLAAARRMPEETFIIASERLGRRGQLPSNVIAGPVSHDEFIDLMRGAAAVVVPMRAALSRAVGQQTYLNAMSLGKPTIVNQTLGVADYVQDGRTAVVVDGTPGGYVRALRWVLDPANGAAVARLGACARDEVNANFSFERHVDHLLALVEEAIGDLGVETSPA